MKREEFVKAVTDLVQRYIDNFDLFDSDPQLRVNPASLEMSLVNSSEMRTAIEYSDEALEEAAASQGATYEDSTDLQVRQNPDFYPLRTLLTPHPAPGFAPTISPGPDAKAIDAVAAVYFD